MKQLLFFMIAVLCASAHSQSNILPTPSFQEFTGEQLNLSGDEDLFDTSKVTIEKGVLNDLELFFLSVQLSNQGIVLVQVDQEPDIQFSYRKHLLPEAYGIYVDDHVEIAYKSPQGRFYGLVSLLFLIEKNDQGQIELPKGKVEDAPAFSWRGLHLDVSRHFFTVEEVKSFLDLMALYKFNTFHWHLTDDQGWRIEIKQYPKLTEVGGFRDSTVIGHYSDSPREYDHTKYGSFYTQDDIRDVVSYAEELHIIVVPEIEMPGHSRAALAAYPELSCTGELQGVPGLWGVFDDIYCSKEESIEFLQNVLDEVLDLFPSEYIHVGGDEAPKSRWDKCENCKKVMEENDLHDSHELQSYFIKRMDTYLTERGRKLIGWDEILEGGLSPNAAVMSWRGEEGGIEAAKQGHYVVMSPTTYCYFDYYQSSHDSEPLAIGGYLPLEKVYRYNPVPKDLTKEEAKYILGGQANIWTEYISDYSYVEYMAFPRALALIQSLWCQKKPTYAEFLKTYLDFHEDYLKSSGVNRSSSIHIPELKIERTENGVGYSWWGMDSSKVFMIGSQYDYGGLAQGSIRNGEIFEVRRDGGDREILLHVNEISLKHDIKVSDILGTQIDLITPPNKNFDHNGSLNIVDGIQGAIPWKGDQWLGFNEGKVELIIELDSVAILRNFNIGFLNQKGSWIYLPESMKVSVSIDKSNWKLIQDVPIEGNENIEREKHLLNTYGKFIKVEIFPLEKIPVGNGGAGTKPWTFIDEIQIDIE